MATLKDYLGEDVVDMGLTDSHRGFIDVLLTECKAVYQALGPGFMEMVYHTALERALYNKNIRFRSEPMIPIQYLGVCCGYISPDLVFDEQQVVLELKSMARKMTNGENCQLHAQLRTVGYGLGILVNFKQIIGCDDIEVDVVRIPHSEEKEPVCMVG